MIDPQEARLFAQSLGLYAASVLRKTLGQQLQRLDKGPGDWATELDSQLEQSLQEKIRQTYPDHGFWGEEGGRSAGSNTPLQWLVDPIDGTVNFSRGYPQFSVSIALLQGGEPLACCIADPCRDELFSAALGRGATVNDQPLRVSAVNRLDQALGATVFPKPNAAFMGPYLRRFGAVLPALAGLRRSGSMALELAYLAAGRVDCFWQQGMGPWDAAAGVLLVREAGGQDFTLDGQGWLASAQLCAAAPGVLQAWKELLLRTP
jgi:myo-inositol-1(or 4)-monophosphatase